MTSLEMLSLPKSQRIFYRIGNFFKSIPGKFARFFRNTPRRFKRLWNLLKSPFVNLYNALIYGDWKVKTSFLIMGFGHLFRKEIAKGILLILFEIAFIAFMVMVGVPSLSKLHNLGDISSLSMNFDPTQDAINQVNYDSSFNILLYSIVTIVIICIFASIWYNSIKQSKILQDMGKVGKYSNNARIISDLGQKEYHKTLLAFPLFGLTMFTIIPIVFMIVIAFTNYSSQRELPTHLFDWVGFNNFTSIFSAQGSSDGLIVSRLLTVLGWTLIWAFFATFSNYFLGMILAILINAKGIKLKKMWRTIFITTIAVPQFISLLLISKMLNSEVGVVNALLDKIGLIDIDSISTRINWLDDIRFGALLPKITIILVNTWVGIPYTMLICTGLLMNIPDDLYESAKIDGASPFKMYMKITLPYMLFVTTPYLISQFVGNINNFNVIYLLSGGNPGFPVASQDPRLVNLGQTDILITWIYKLTKEAQIQDYGSASVLSIFIFAIVATFSLIFYSRSNSVKNEEDFQ